MYAEARLLRPREIRWLVVLLSLGVSFRLIQISQPFIDAWSWRQSDVAMIAENFYRHGFRLFYPQINWAGKALGYVGTEFQLVPFIAALFYICFGIHDWIGRAVSVFFFAVSVPFFYLLVRKVSNERSALLAVGIYICTPLSIYTGRSFMPDMASLSLSTVALYLFAEWLERGRAPWLFTVMCLMTSLAILVKLPAVIIGSPLLYMAWQKYGARWVVRRELWGFAALSLLLPLAWYVHAYFLSIRHFPYHFFGAGGIEIKDLGWYMGILHWTVTESLTPIVVGAMLIGGMLPSHATFGHVFHWWLIALLIFVFFAGEGNRHQWYQLPMVPVAAAFAGLSCDFALRTCAQATGAKMAAVLCCIFYAALAYLSYSSLKPLYEPQPQRVQAWQLGNALNHITPADALVIIADDGDPTTIYYSRRKGWHFLQDGMLTGYPLNSQQAIMQLEKWRTEGANYLGFTQDAFWQFNASYTGFQEYLEARYRRVRETQEYLIFSLTMMHDE